jgi:hypothetical protein
VVQPGGVLLPALGGVIQLLQLASQSCELSALQSTLTRWGADGSGTARQPVLSTSCVAYIIQRLSSHLIGTKMLNEPLAL